MVFVLLEFENTNIPGEPFGQNMTKNIHRNILETCMSSMIGERIFQKNTKTSKCETLIDILYTSCFFRNKLHISLLKAPSIAMCFFLERLRFKFGATKRESLEVG